MFLDLRLLSGVYTCSYHVLSGRHARFRFLGVEYSGTSHSELGIHAAPQIAVEIRVSGSTSFRRSRLGGVIFVLHVHFCGSTNRAIINQVFHAMKSTTSLVPRPNMAPERFQGSI
jgi:hypothetical protein